MSSVFHENLGVRISALRTVAAITSVFPQTDDHINSHYLFFNKVVNDHDHDGLMVMMMVVVMMIMIIMMTMMVVIIISIIFILNSINHIQKIQ